MSLKDLIKGFQLGRESSDLKRKEVCISLESDGVLMCSPEADTYFSDVMRGKNSKLEDIGFYLGAWSRPKIFYLYCKDFYQSTIKRK
ncbi:MAG: hypothetical protein KKA65_01620 [Nanoarchaeota archaeon]|nr:hypothetical protein [Nanoarchaeota archaeon]MBU4351811.1 hypothetical protein [Nanoarchaeota archaeon]MBU4456175.1 hypothetical protein [Nanoarchaeota archaeon]MCG2719557.1 hypothetical protein [Nanoarchaeota archaeon]